MKFKIGDRVIGKNKIDRFLYERDGRTGVVVKTNKKDFVVFIDHDSKEYVADYKDFELIK